MWLQTTIGNFSIIQTEDDRRVGMLTISSYCRSDLNALAAKYLHDTKVEYGDENSEAHFHIRSTHARVSAAIALAVADIYYSDLTRAVSTISGDYRAKNLMSIECDISSMGRAMQQESEQEISNEYSKPKMVLQIGGEGGGIILWAHSHGEVKLFSIQHDEDCGLLDKDDMVDPIHTHSISMNWDDAMKFLPESWPELYPVFVSQEFWPLIEKKMRQCGVTPNSDWERAIKDSSLEQF